MTALLLAVFALGAVLRLPTLFRPLWSDDEAIYATTADALQRGARLYRDVVDHKPPLVYHLYQAGFAAFGSYDTRGVHLLLIVAVLLTAAALFAIVRADEPSERTRATPAGLAAAGLFLVFSTTWHDYDALAANCELFLLAPQSLAAWLLVRGLGRPSRGARAVATHLAVGALIGTSALLKYQGLTFLGASIGSLIAWAFLGRMPWSRAGLAAACQLAGALVPPALYLLWCAHAGNLDAALYWFRFNFTYVHAGLGGSAALARGLRRTAMIGGVAFVPYALGLSAAVTVASRARRTIRARWHRSLEPTGDRDAPPPSQMLGLLWLAASAIALAAGGRFFGHYFHLSLAPLCLLAAPGFCRLWAQRGWRRSALLVLCAVPALVFCGLATLGRPLAAAWDEREPPYDDVAARIAALTGPDDRIFVWGNSPQLYVLARRPMGARFSFCNYMTGESPGTPTETGAWNADDNQLPAAWDMLFEDLDRRRPALFVDAAAAGWDGYGKYPLARYPRLQAYVERHYRSVETRAGVVLYERAR